MIAVLAIILLVHQARALFRQSLAMLTQTIKALASIGLAILVVATLVAFIVAANVLH